MNLNQLTAINDKVDEAKQQRKFNSDRLKRTYRYHDVNSTSDDSVLYDSLTNSIYSFGFTDENCKKYKSEIDDLVNNRTFDCPFQKIPYTTDKAIKDKDGSLTFNTFNSPAAYYLPKASGNKPQAFLFLVNCLFHEDSREYVFNWLANSLHRKNFTYLIIYSKTRGTGKGLFGNVAKALHLSENSFEISQRSFNSQFNGSLRGKTLLVGNELEIRTKEHSSILKKFVDDETCYEGKGKDAVTDKQYANLIITTNYPDCVDLSEEERRFSIPYANENKLIENPELKLMFGSVDNFAEQLKNEYADIFHFLYHRKISHDMQHAHLSPKHAEMKEESLTDWQREAREFLSIESQMSKSGFVTASRIKECLDNCDDLNKSKIPGKKVIADFLKSENNVTKTTKVKNDFFIYYEPTPDVSVVISKESKTGFPHASRIAV